MGRFEEIVKPQNKAILGYRPMSKATPLFARTDQVIKHRSDGHQQRATPKRQRQDLLRRPQLSYAALAPVDSTGVA